MAVVNAKKGLLGAVLVRDEASRSSGAPNATRVAAVLELVNRWMTDKVEPTEEPAIAWCDSCGTWSISLAPDAAGVRAWWLARWPGCRTGSAEAASWALGRGSLEAMRAVETAFGPANGWGRRSLQMNRRRAET